MKPEGQGRIVETSLLASLPLSMTFILTFWRLLLINNSVLCVLSYPGYIIPADVNVFDKIGYIMGSHSISRPKVITILLSWSFFHCFLLWRIFGWNPKPYRALWCIGFRAWLFLAEIFPNLSSLGLLSPQSAWYSSWYFLIVLAREFCFPQRRMWHWQIQGIGRNIPLRLCLLQGMGHQQR